MSVSSTGTTSGTNSILSRVAANQAAQASSTASTGNTILGSGTDTKTLNANFDMFLQLLTTQLRNQSPLDPMKTEQFAQQITQFSAVEQQIKTNQMLERLVSSQATGATTAALGFLGNDVTATGNAADLRNGAATWSLNAAGAATATLTIRNAAGAVVSTQARTLTSGANTFTWNGRDQNGVALAEGTYRISIEAKDGAGAPVSVTTAARGRVTAVDFSTGEPILTVGGSRVKLSEVTNVTLAP